MVREQTMRLVVHAEVLRATFFFGPGEGLGSWLQNDDLLAATTFTGTLTFNNTMLNM